MVSMDLRFNIFRDGTLYRAGKGVQVPDHVAAWIRGPVKVEAPEVPAAPPFGEVEERLPDGYPFSEILSAGGFKSHAAVQRASDADLIALDGIGPARLRELRAYEPL